MLDVRQVDDVMYNVLVDRSGRHRWNLLGNIFQYALLFPERESRKICLSSAVKQDLQKRYDTTIRGNVGVGARHLGGAWHSGISCIVIRPSYVIT